MCLFNAIQALVSQVSKAKVQIMRVLFGGVDQVKTAFQTAVPPTVQEGSLHNITSGNT